MFRTFKHLNYKSIAKPQSQQEIFKVFVKDLLPTQMCLGLSEVWSRQNDFSRQSSQKIHDYFKNKPIPIVSNNRNDLWILDRHHRLRAILELDKDAEAYGYQVATIDSHETNESLNFLAQQGWLYLYDDRGKGPYSPQSLPQNLLKMRDDPYRSLVWKLKKEGFISPASLIPYHEFHWANWLRKKPLPPFNSKNLSPALSIARKLACSHGASHLKGWKGNNN